MASDSEKARSTYELFCYCREEGGHVDFLRRAEMAQRYYASRQWNEADMRKRTQEGRLSFTVNEIFRTINAVRGELQNLSTDVRFDPGPGGSQQVASVLNKLSEHIDNQNKAYAVDDRVRLDALLTGRGFWELRVDFDENMQGTITRKHRRPQNIVLDADMTTPDPSDWQRVFTTEVVSLNDLKNMYGRKVKDIKDWPAPDWIDTEDRNLAQSLGYNQPTKDGGFDLSREDIKQFRLINHQYVDYKYKEFFVDLRTGDMSEIPENWPDEKVQYALDRFNLGTLRRKAKTIRWRVTCNDVVLHDEDSPYKFFTIVPYFPFFLDGYPVSLFDVLQGPQDMLNYTVSEELQILGTTSHSGWKVKHGSLKNMTMRQLEQKGASNGLILELEEVGDAERITPGQPANGFERLGDRSRGWISDLASVTPAMQGTQGQYANGKSTNSMLSRAPVNLSAALTAFQFSMNLLAERKLNLIQTFYTETRTLRIAPNPYADAQEITINEPDAYDQIANDVTVGEYTVRMMPATSRSTAEELSFDQLLELKEIGIQVPNSLFITNSALQAKSDVIDQLLEANNGEVSPEEQAMQQLQLAQLQAEVDDTAAGAEQKRSAAELNQARAQKNLADAQYNPHAERNQNERARLSMQFATDNRRLSLDEKRMDRESALKLTEIQENAIQDNRKLAVQAAGQRQKSNTPKQPRRGSNP